MSGTLAARRKLKKGPFYRENPWDKFRAGTGEKARLVRVVIPEFCASLNQDLDGFANECCTLTEGRDRAALLRDKCPLGAPDSSWPDWSLPPGHANLRRQTTFRSGLSHFERQLRIAPRPAKRTGRSVEYDWPGRGLRRFRGNSAP